MAGGLRASLHTDVWQAAFLVVVIVLLLGLVLASDSFSLGGLVAGVNQDTGPGWVLLLVALLQVLSYPLHDPVMMDRGFLADRDTTRQSFLRAFAISALLILAFGVIGVHTGRFAADDGDFLTTLDRRLLGGPAMFLVGLALVLSAVSTMDSTFSSVSKLMVVDSGLMRRTLANGRRAMAGFAAGGLFLVFFGTDDLYAAVAVSGTASLFLTPVIVFCIFLGRRVAGWSPARQWCSGYWGAVLFFLEDSGYITVLAELTGLEHTYSHLLVVTVGILVVGFTVFIWVCSRSVTPVLEIWGMMQEPGRSCPIGYRTSPEGLAGLAPRAAETLYVIGGLYGNREALDDVEALAAREEAKGLPRPTLVFNGDFNWFNAEPAAMAEINDRVLAHTALQGNVETELADRSPTPAVAAPIRNG